MSSNWKNASDFASLSAAISQMKQAKRPKLEEAKQVEAEETVQVEEEKQAEAVKVEEEKQTETVDEKQLSEAAIEEEEEKKLANQESTSFEQEPSFLTHFIDISGHKSGVSCLAFEKSGARLISGSHDSTVAYWDFAGMTRSSPAPFRFLQPLGNNPLKSIAISADSQWIILAASTPAAKLFDRNGGQIREYAKGDPYLRDLRHTIGHIAGVNAACWSPIDEDRFLTASEDGCVRQWHIGFRAESEAVMQIRSPGRTTRCPVTALVCSKTLIFTGSDDGAIKSFPLKVYGCETLPMPNQPLFQAKLPSRISSLALIDEQRIAARSVDGIVAVFNTADLKEITRFTQLESSSDEVQVCALDDDILATGSKHGVVLLDLTSLERSLLLTSSEVISLAWNGKCGQLAAGLINGTLNIFLSADGRGGARLMRAEAQIKKYTGEAAIDAGQLYAPDVTVTKMTQRKLEKLRADPVATHRPELPVYGQGQGGRLGSNVTQQIMRNVLKDTSRDQDPREALLAYAEKAKKNPKWVDMAYAETQPEPVFDASLLEKEAREEAERKRRHEEMERLKAERSKRQQ